MSHGGTERTEVNAMSRRHRRCIERRSLFANSISNLYTKRLPQNSYQESVRYTSVALCAVSTSVILCLPPSLRDSVCLLYKTFSLSLHISEEPYYFHNKCVCLYKKYCTFALVIGKSFCPFHLPERY